MKDWDDLRTVLALGRAGTMKGAALTIGVSETTIARRIKRLSGKDTSMLFGRDGQRWIPTEEGRRLIGIAEEVEKQIIAADGVFAGHNEGLSGELRVSSISFINTYFLGPAMPTLTAENPELKIALEATDERVSLAYREADVAMRLARPTEGRLIGKRVALIPIAAVAPAGVRPRSWVGLQHTLDWTPEMRQGVSTFGAGPDIRIDSFDGILSMMTSMNIGGIAPTCMIRAKGLKLDTLSPPVHRELWVTYHEDLRHSPRIRGFIDWLGGIFPSANRCLCGACN
ncbi:MAG: LysR family transcriptional regulator [Pseudomonadota bacterium]